MVDSSGLRELHVEKGHLVLSGLLCTAFQCEARKARAQPPRRIGANPLMAYVPGGGALPTTDEKPAPAVAKRAVKKGAKGGSCCC